MEGLEQASLIHVIIFLYNKSLKALSITKAKAR
jgi:hypothetical protein